MCLVPETSHVITESVGWNGLPYYVTLLPVKCPHLAESCPDAVVGANCCFGSEAAIDNSVGPMAASARKAAIRQAYFSATPIAANGQKRSFRN